MVSSAGCALITERVAEKPEGLDLAGLLDVIEAETKDAPDRLQWAMNSCLARIGIEHAEHHDRQKLAIEAKRNAGTYLHTSAAAAERSPQQGSTPQDS